MSDDQFRPGLDHFPPDFFVATASVNYEPIPGTTIARITGVGTQCKGEIERSRQQGQNIVALDISQSIYSVSSANASALVFDAVTAAHYLDLSGEEPVAVERPTVDWGFDKAEILVREEATLANIPPCEVRFRGPVNGSQAHDVAGDLTIGFTTPGTYSIAFEAFPYRKATLQLVVKPRGAVEVDLEGIEL